jgi:hypothetical protein
MAKKKNPSAETAAEPPMPANDVVAPAPSSGLSRPGSVVLALALVLINVPLIHAFVFRSEQAVKFVGTYQTGFESPDVVRGDFFSTGAYWRVENGELVSPGSKNNPLWAQTRLADDAVVEFDVKSLSPEGDIKFEIFGNGVDHASGYVLIFGGWNNSISIIARLDEHGPNFATIDKSKYLSTTRTRVEANPYKVEMGRTYHFRVERKGSLLVWSIDGREFMRFDDPIPLVGKGHDRFGFSSWESQLVFDNLSIRPAIQ